ncbi:hypothetical protein Zmor_026818 [Zophobas morio]|uniref:Nose resistant-to-fluoxetine protein N-terminal domain-containing protein n=1 Tax=Zophobas morio TaxID=2755281 RepID=A0AA38HVB5_9CUCU|nr:hypothetical protein Zmor_026818 [Zophobas morio]
MKYIIIALLLSVIPNKSCSEITYEGILTNISTKAREMLSPECQKDLSRTTILTTTYWLMVDASSRIPSGIAKGNIMPMGNYDECLEIQEVETKFCQASINLDSPSETDWKIAPPHKRIKTEVVGVNFKSADISFGLYYCVLKSCNTQDLNIIFPGFVRFDDSQCWAKDSGPKLDALAIVAIVIFALIALITLISTIYDIYLNYRNLDPICSSAIAFSLYSNGKKIFHLGNSQQLLCLNGIKSLSMLWVVLGHVYMAYVFVPLDNYLDVYNWIESTYSQYITGATVSVDTFFVVGGFLTIYTFQATMDKGVTFNVPLYYFHRYLRLTPAVAAMVLAHAALFNYFGSGPVWQRTDTFLTKACKEYWWSALLYVQNYANPEGTCVPQSWYLSVDMQLFLISPAILILMRQWPFWGYLFLSVASLASIIGSFLLGWFYELGGQLTANVNGNLTDFMKYYYMPTHTRMVPYLFGIMLGYAIYSLKTNKRKPHLNMIVVSCGWILSLALMATCLYAGQTLQTTEYNRLENSFFIALMRPAWAIAICWVIFTCVMEYGGPINTFLSCSLFQISSRLCYSIYIVHYSFIFMTNFSTRSPLHFSDYYAFHKFWGDLAFTIGIAVVWTLIFECPVIVLEKTLLKRTDSKNKTNKQNKFSLV